MTPAHPIIRWLADSIISVAGDRRPKYEKSLYLLKDHRDIGQIASIQSEGGVPQLLSGKHIINLLDELLILPDMVS